MTNSKQLPVNQQTKIFMLDNLDSFTYNLVDEFKVLGFDPTIYRNTLSADFIIEQIEKCQAPVLLVLSPGPGDPSSSGCLMELIEKTAGKYPVLGICLGHQALAQYYGATVTRAPEIVHGKASNVSHNGEGAFKGMVNPLPVARYHSLVVNNIQAPLVPIARCAMNSATDNDTELVMAISHEEHAILGLQFHPESILTTYGSMLLEQSIEYLIDRNAALDSNVSNRMNSHESIGS